MTIRLRVSRIFVILRSVGRISVWAYISIQEILIIELKWDDSPESAINQMKKKHYPDALKRFDGPILLVGISYDKDSKVYECQIEKWQRA